MSWGTIPPATEVLAHNLIDRCWISPVRERNDRAIRALNDDRRTNDRSILPAGRLRRVDCVKGVAPDNPVGSGGLPSSLGGGRAAILQHAYMKPKLRRQRDFGFLFAPSSIAQHRLNRYLPTVNPAKLRLQSSSAMIFTDCPSIT